MTAGTKTQWSMSRGTRCAFPLGTGRGSLYHTDPASHPGGHQCGSPVWLSGKGTDCWRQAQSSCWHHRVPSLLPCPMLPLCLGPLCPPQDTHLVPLWFTGFSLCICNTGISKTSILEGPSPGQAMPPVPSQHPLAQHNSSTWWGPSVRMQTQTATVCVSVCAL